MKTSLPSLSLVALLTISLVAVTRAQSPPATDDAATAEPKTTPVTYHIGAEEFEGCFAEPAKSTVGSAGAVPGVLVVHDWTGLGPFAQARAVQLAKLGYIAFAADMYGKGKRASQNDRAAAGALAKPFYQDFSLFRVRAQAALAELLKRPGVDPQRIGAIGFCFGGTTVLELARSGADMKGVVSFHGGLKSPNTADAKNVKGRLLVLHGSLDPSVPPADVAGFMTEMNTAGVAYKLVAYPRSVHAFTNPEAGTDISKGVAYNAQAAEAAYGEMRQFFSEIFAGGAPSAQP
ncbi:MAG: dienelactone hydrolase family protein [Verrucomicrobia bacterium]|nr:dienelactone hydrolase family protein [Verrucomicrobiota bacterium]